MNNINIFILEHFRKIHLSEKEVSFSFLVSYGRNRRVNVIVIFYDNDEY